MITGYNEATLATSDVFQGLNDKNVILNKAITLIQNPKNILSKEDIEAAYINIQHSLNTLSKTAIKAFDEGRIVLIYNEIKSLSVSQVLPFVTLRRTNGYTTYIFMDNFIDRGKDGFLRVQEPILRDLLHGALISNALKGNYDVFAANQFLQKLLMGIYTTFVTRVINRKHTINPDKVLFDTITYWSNRFFLESVFKAHDLPENIEKIAGSHFRYIDEGRYPAIKAAYDNAKPDTIKSLLALIQTSSPLVKSLDFHSFFSEWINYYYPIATLAMEVPEYLIFMILTLLSGNNLVSLNAASIVKETKNIKMLQEELLKLI